VRQLCDECKEEDIVAEHHTSQFGIDTYATVYKGCGCDKCNYTGYAKRVAIAELFILDDNVKTALYNNVDDKQLISLAKQNNMVSLFEQLRQMIIDGKTSLEEAIRIGIKE